MGSIYFKYGAMNATKSTQLATTLYNYTERGLKGFALKPCNDTRDTKESRIVSRLGVSVDATLIPTNNLKKTIKIIDSIIKPEEELDIVVIDESQFLSKETIVGIVDHLESLYPDITIMFFGLRNSFTGESFDGIPWLLEFADHIEEIKTMCWCGKKATCNLMYDMTNKRAIRNSSTGNIVVGGNDIYFSVCRHHFKLGIPKRELL